MSTNKGCMGYYRYEHRDPYQSKYYTAISISVMRPTIEKPFVSVLASVANASGKVTFRCRDLSEVCNILVLPQDAIDRLQEYVNRGNQIADELEREYKLMFEMRHLPDKDKSAALDEINKILKGRD